MWDYIVGKLNGGKVQDSESSRSQPEGTNMTVYYRNHAR